MPGITHKVEGNQRIGEWGGGGGGGVIRGNQVRSILLSFGVVSLRDSGFGGLTPKSLRKKYING